MFRKVQLKFFAIITGTLIAIFIAVLGSINLIMNAVLERQSKVVLKQIAADVEYNSRTGKFTYNMPDKPKIAPRPTERTDPPTEEASTQEDNTEPITAGSSTEASTAGSTGASTAQSSAAPSTSPKADAVAPEEPQEEPVQEPEPENVPQEEPQPQPEPEPQPEPAHEEPQPQPQQTQPPQPEPQTPELPPPAEDSHAPSNYGHQDDQFDWNDYWTNYWKNYWQFWDNYYKSNPTGPADSGFPMYPMYPYGKPPGVMSDKPKEEKNDGRGETGGIVKMANTFAAPILDGFTVEVYAEETEPATEATQPPPPPVRAASEEDPFPKSMGSIDFFVLMADKEGNYVSGRNNDDIDKETAQKYITKILKSQLTTGTVDHYQFCTAEKTNGTLIAFTDKSAEIDMLHNLTRTTIIIGIISIIALSAASYFLSGVIVQPIEKAFNNQKQFISDASHELKTPLTVITANADILSDEIGQNKWLTYIKDQAERMNVLVNELLNLTRLENNTTNFTMTEFNLSQAIEKTALPFESQAFESNKRFELNIVKDLYIVGSEQHIKQMAAIFIDNALKYSNDGGIIRVTLAKQGDKKVLYVYNSGQGVKEDEKDKVFERFFRSDMSRNRSSGGYGLGLAIAKTIIDRHKFRVHIENNPGRGVCFVITMG